MKCPFCGYESKEQTCERCKALIPADKPKEEPKDEPTKVYKRKMRSE